MHERGARMRDLRLNLKVEMNRCYCQMFSLSALGFSALLFCSTHNPQSNFIQGQTINAELKLYTQAFNHE